MTIFEKMNSMEKKSALILSFIAGAAAGAVVGYLLASGKGEEMLADVKEAAGKFKDEFDKQIDNGKEILEEIKNMSEEQA